MLWKESAGYGVGAMGCFQISSERMEILVPTRMISGENTAELAMFLATSAAPGAPGPRQTPIVLMDAPCWARGRGRWRQRADRVDIDAMVHHFDCLFWPNLGF